jgi:hypothetical protein
MVSDLRRDTRTREPILDCSPQRDVVCFDRETRGGDVETLCHPTFAVCRSHVDHNRTSPDDDIRVVSECAREPGSSASAGVDPDEAAHWWCLSLLHGELGSCNRSRTRCEEGRDFALRNRPNPSDDVSECTSQRSATCFENRAGGRTLLQCHPTVDTCQAHHEREQRQGQAPGQITDCHPLE